MRYSKRMEISWIYRVSKDEAVQRVKEDMTILETTRKRKANFMFMVPCIADLY